MRAIIAGGAPLSPDVHEFLRICLRVNLAQVSNYGLASRLFTKMMKYTIRDNNIINTEVIFLL